MSIPRHNQAKENLLLKVQKKLRNEVTKNEIKIIKKRAGTSNVKGHRIKRS